MNERLRYFLVGGLVGAAALYSLQCYGNYLAKSIRAAADRGVNEALIECGLLDKGKDQTTEKLESKVSR